MRNTNLLRVTQKTKWCSQKFSKIIHGTQTHDLVNFSASLNFSNAKLKNRITSLIKRNCWKIYKYLHHHKTMEITLLFIFEILASISGVLMASAGFPQALKIFRTKSAKDISLSSRLMLLIGGLIWLVYGFLLSSFAIIISNIFGTVAEILVLIGYVKYK